jgi:uncharacterized damage-inducible protein DinB
MANEAHIELLKATRAFFEKSISCFRATDAEFAPREGLFTVAQQIAHAAQTVEWFLEGAFRPQGMNLDFESQESDVRIVKELEDAMAWWNSAWDEAIVSVGNTAPEAWNEPIRGEIMAGSPRHAVISGIVDHTAHHRGALTVYARLLDLDPPMPYG